MRIFLQLIIPLIFALITFNLISYVSGFNTFSYLSIPLAIIKYLLPLIVFIFVFTKIIPRIYKFTENKAVSSEEVSESAKILSSESNISISNLKGFIGLYVKIISFLLNHPAKVII